MNVNIETLLKAAQYLADRDREAEHGYASALPGPRRSFDLSNQTISITKRPRFKKSASSSGVSLISRSTHNELEKNRRAHLRHCLESLKDLVPVGVDGSSRHTTLGLLNKAKGFIRSLEEKERKQKQQKEKLRWEQQCLLRRMKQLPGSLISTSKTMDIRRLRSISESSSGVSSASTSPTSEVDEATSTSSSNSSFMETEDGGVTMAAKNIDMTIVMKRLVVESQQLN